MKYCTLISPSLLVLTAVIALGSHSAMAQSPVPYPGPLPNQPPSNAPIEQKYYANGSWAVSHISGVLDTSSNQSVDRFGFSYPCSSTTSFVGIGNASNSGSSTIPYDIWYPTNLGNNGFKHPIIVFGGGDNPAVAAPLPPGAPAGATPVLITPDNASGADYYLRHLASWGFVVIATQSGRTGNGLQDICAAKYMMGLNSNPSPLLMVEETQQTGPQELNGIAILSLQNQTYENVTNVQINETVPVAWPVIINNVVGGIPITYPAANPFYGNLAVQQIAVMGLSEGAFGAVNALIDGAPIFKTAVSIEEPANWTCGTTIVSGLLGQPEPLDNTCPDTTGINYGSIFFVNGSLDALVSPSTQSSCAYILGDPQENSDMCMYSDVPGSVSKAWATLIGANHQDLSGQPWCIDYAIDGPNFSIVPNWTAINYWTLLGVPPDYGNISAPPASPIFCGADQSANAALGDNPAYGGVFGYLGYTAAWLMDQLQGDSYAHGAFISGTGEMFQETTNWQNQTSNITH